MTIYKTVTTSLLKPFIIKFITLFINPCSYLALSTKSLASLILAAKYGLPPLSG